MQKILITIVKFYQKFISIYLGKRCRFYPSCSQYMIDAVEKYGFLKGFFKGIKRILRCHPLNPGGIDQIGDKK